MAAEAESQHAGQPAQGSTHDGPSLLSDKQQAYMGAACALRYILRRIAPFLPGNPVGATATLNELQAMQYCSNDDYKINCSGCGARQDICMLHKVRPAGYA
jgi:hypothetical protein